MNNMQKEQLRQLRSDGYSYSRIAAKMKLSINTVKTFCNRNGLGGIASKGSPNVKTFCLYCGDPVVQTRGRKKKQFCSDLCRNSYWNSHLSMVNRKAYYEYTCPACGKAFTVYGNSNRKYCSYECYVKARWRHA